MIKWLRKLFHTCENNAEIDKVNLILYCTVCLKIMMRVDRDAMELRFND